MREILFRGRTIGGATWVEGAYCPKNCDTLFGKMVDRPSIIKLEPPYDGFWIDVEPFSVGQFTGLRDKNGKRIFEGDIIRYGLLNDYECYLESLEHPEEYDSEVYDQDIEVDVVTWQIEQDYPAFDLESHNFECNGLAQIMCGDYEYEVIGNIHDNPELLNGGADNG